MLYSIWFIYLLLFSKQSPYWKIGYSHCTFLEKWLTSCVCLKYSLLFLLTINGHLVIKQRNTLTKAHRTGRNMISQSDSRSRNKNQPQHTVICHLKQKTNSVLRILCISVTVVTVMPFQNESSSCFQLLHFGLHCRVVSEYMVGTFVQSKTRRFTP